MEGDILMLPGDMTCRSLDIFIMIHTSCSLENLAHKTVM
uniref:Uncharacterized protein n=1 Tax=viral metagenome TaxID=1070528 RepID=A0A6C0BLP0_9ZZZZ